MNRPVNASYISSFLIDRSDGKPEMAAECPLKAELPRALSEEVSERRYLV